MDGLKRPIRWAAPPECDMQLWQQDAGLFLLCLALVKGTVTHIPTEMCADIHKKKELKEGGEAYIWQSNEPTSLVKVMTFAAHSDQYASLQSSLPRAHLAILCFIFTAFFRSCFESHWATPASLSPPFLSSSCTSSLSLLNWSTLQSNKFHSGLGSTTVCIHQLILSVRMRTCVYVFVLQRKYVYVTSFPA